MPVTQTLSPARELVATNTAHFPNESALLVEEIELRRHIERVAAQRRALPHGGEVQLDFELVSETGSIRFSSLFGDKDTLMVYSMMYGPERKAPCPSCTSFLSSWNGTVVNLRERSAIAVTARSPIDRCWITRNSVASRISRLSPTCPATTRAPMSIRTTPTYPALAFSPDVTERFSTTTAAK
jgi:predicted dithiol-disulfide oxidoreductase (DUF899 family)